MLGLLDLRNLLVRRATRFLGVLRVLVVRILFRTLGDGFFHQFMLEKDLVQSTQQATLPSHHGTKTSIENSN